MVEELLQLLVGEVDAKLLEAVVLRDIEVSRDIIGEVLIEISRKILRLAEGRFESPHPLLMWRSIFELFFLSCFTSRRGAKKE